MLLMEPLKQDVVLPFTIAVVQGAIMEPAKIILLPFVPVLLIMWK